MLACTQVRARTHTHTLWLNQFQMQKKNEPAKLLKEAFEARRDDV